MAGGFISVVMTMPLCDGFTCTTFRWLHHVCCRLGWREEEGEGEGGGRGREREEEGEGRRREEKGGRGRGRRRDTKRGGGKVYMV